MPPMFPQWKIEVRVVFEISLKGSVGKAGQSTYVKGISLSRAYCSAKESFSTFSDSCLQLLNASLSISTTEPGIRTLVRLLQFAKVYFFNSVVVTVFSVLLVLIMTNMAGYVLGRYKFVGRGVLMAVFLSSICIPLVSTLIPVYQIVKSMNLLGTRLGLILSGAGGAHVVFLLLFSSYYSTVPNELEEAAKIDGCGFLRTFVKVMMPLSSPISTTVIIMESLWTWNAFQLPLILTLNNPTARTLAVGLYAFKGENTVDWTGICAGGAIAMVPIIVVFIAFQKFFINGMAGAVKG